MRAALTICLKDLRQRMRDRSAILMALVIPLALSFGLDAVLSGATATTAFRFGVVNHDRGRLGSVFADHLLPEIERTAPFTVKAFDRTKVALDAVEEDSLDASFVVPAGFTRSVEGGGGSLRVVGNPDSPVAADVAESIARSFSADLEAIRLSIAAALVPGEDAEALASRAARTVSPVVVEEAEAQNRQLDNSTYFAAGMSVFFLFFTVQFGVASLLDERHGGTMARLVAAPIGRSSILAGKLLASFVLGAISTAILVVATTFLLGASWGDPLGVALLIAAGVLAATGVTAVVSSFAKDPEQAGGWQAVVVTLMGLLGGAFFPMAQASELMGKVSLLTPHAWFLRGLGDMAGGQGAGAVLIPVAAMLAFAAVTSGFALTRLNKVVQL